MDHSNLLLIQSKHPYAMVCAKGNSFGKALLKGWGLVILGVRIKYFTVKKSSFFCDFGRKGSSPYIYLIFLNSLH